MGLLSPILFLLLLHTANGLSSPSLKNNRHVCLFNRYEAVKGPHFSALFDQLWGETGFDSKRVAYITCGEDTLDESTKAQLEEELDLEIQTIHLPTTETPTIRDPDQLQAQIRDWNPSILWMGGPPQSNAFALRHALRVLDLDTMVHDLCGPATGRACLLVGEGSGALCAGSNMAVAALRGDDPKACPEWQFRGLQALGPGRSVSFEKPLQCTPPLHLKDEVQLLQDKIATLPLYDSEEETTVFLNPQQVYVYSQQEGADTTSLVMNPYQRGAIEQYESSSLPPAPPLSSAKGGSSSSSSVARDCTGEPSEDPPRTVYTTQVEEGDYW